MQDIKKWTLPFGKRCVKNSFKVVGKKNYQKTTKVFEIGGKVWNRWNR